MFAKAKTIYPEKVLPGIVFLFMSALLPAQDTTRFSFEHIVQRMDSVFPEILQYDSRIKSLQARVEGAGAWMPPEFSFGLNQFPYKISTMNDAGPMNTAGLMFSAQQMIPNPVKLNAKRNYLQSLSPVENSNREWTRNTLRLVAGSFFYRRLIAERKLQLIASGQELLELLVKTSAEKFPYNQSDLSTIFKAKAKLGELHTMETMLQSEIAESNAGLSALMGRGVDKPFSIDTTLVFKQYELLPPVTDTNTIDRADIAVMKNSIAAMRLNRDYMNSFRKPDFGVRVEHMQSFGTGNMFSMMGMITIPVVPWSSNMYKSEAKAMEFMAQAMEMEKRSMQSMALQMINEKRIMLNNETRQLKIYEEEILPMYASNFEAGLLAWRNNTGSFFVLLDSWEMLIMKKLEYNDKILTVLKLQAEYEYETGKR